MKDYINYDKKLKRYKKSSLSSESMIQPQMNFNDDDKNSNSANLVRYNVKEIFKCLFPYELS